MKKEQKRVSMILRKIVELFQSGNVPKAIAIATFPSYKIPSSTWSLGNKLIMAFVGGTADARGFKQWKAEKRMVKKGERAFHILAPQIIKVKEKKEEKDADYVCVGFFPIPVFGLEQTEGEPLAYEKIKLPDFPLMAKAQEWNIDVKSMPFAGHCRGFYSFKALDGKEKIRLATSHEKTFFHELAHAAHGRIIKLRLRQDSAQEIVAELSAQVLSQLVGAQLGNTLGNSFEYIRSYSKDRDVGKACMMAISDVEKVLQLILE